MMTVLCEYWTDLNIPNVGRCDAKKGKIVSTKECVHCDIRKPIPLTVGATFIGPPRPPTPPADIAVVEHRLTTCRACSANQGITEKMGTVVVRCAECKECGNGRSLTAASQTCPIKKW